MNENQRNQNSVYASQSVRTALLYTLIGLAMIGLAIVLWRLSLPFIRTFESLRQPAPPFQLFVFCASVALIVVATIELRKRKGALFEELVPVLLPVLVSFQYLIFMRQTSARSWDYECYEKAAQAIIAGANPYGDCYLYWPFVAQSMATVQRLSAIGAAALSIEVTANGNQLWDLVFYLYEATQFLLIVLAYFLCYRFARSLGLKSIIATLLVTVLFLFNNPLIATVKYNQVNLWVLNLILFAILLLRTYPLLSGLAVAIGGHIKLYPLVLLLPWALTKQIRALIGAGIGLITIVMIQTGGGQNWQLWTQFFAFADSFPKGRFFRDNSLHSVIYNFYGQVGRLFGLDTNNLQPTVDLLFSGAIGVIFVYFLVRFIRRERTYATQVKMSAVQPEDHRQEATARFYGHAMDALALGLMTSPVVWEHHYVLAIPLVIWAFATQGMARPWQVGIGAFLIFAIPTFDVFPLSYHRILGLLFLVHITWPAALILPVPLPTRVAQVQGLFK